MFKWIESRVLWGSLLILGGFLFLLDNLGIASFGGLVWAVVLVLGGLFFMGVFLSNRQNWWALIPGMALLAAGTATFLQEVFPSLANVVGGLIVLGTIGVAFLLIYWMSPANWWAIIPAGVLLTLGLISVVDNLNARIETGGLFMLGLGLTFALVALLPRAGNSMRWAWIPAGIFLLMGLLITLSAESSLNIVGPLLLIIAGGYLLLRTFRPRVS